MRILPSLLLCLIVSTIALAAPTTSQVSKFFDVIGTVDAIVRVGETSPETFCQTVSKLNLLQSNEGSSCQNKIKELEFIGFHGTVAKNIDSFHNGIAVFDPQNPNDSKESAPITRLRHGRGFYMTDSIMAARYYQTNAVEQCSESVRQGSAENVPEVVDPKCRPALCGVFAKKKFWSIIPKLYVRQFRETNEGYKKLWYDMDGTEEAISEYMAKKGITRKPLLFSPVFSAEGKDMQVAVPPEHTGHLVAFCTLDSVASKLFLEYDNAETITQLPVDLTKEMTESAGRFFGPQFENMLNLNYWRQMKIHDGIERGENNDERGAWEVDSIGVDWSKTLKTT
ncbi:hypothetical protein BKA69DRAFT_1042491 [Paraphysoderma sedebokerense]|nr:hypothetical protein BKA69DRAFT_1042491 [Paraphysoderma sedebokerense]